MSVYKVTGSSEYRGHMPGTTFEARLPAPMERRAIRRGNIELVEESTPRLQPGSYKLPRHA